MLASKMIDAENSASPIEVLECRVMIGNGAYFVPWKVHKSVACHIELVRTSPRTASYPPKVIGKREHREKDEQTNWQCDFADPDVQGIRSVTELPNDKGGGNWR